MTSRMSSGSLWSNESSSSLVMMVPVGLLGLQIKTILVRGSHSLEDVFNINAEISLGDRYDLCPHNPRLEVWYCPKVEMGMSTSSSGSKNAKATSRDQLICPVGQDDLIWLQPQVCSDGAAQVISLGILI